MSDVLDAMKVNSKDGLLLRQAIILLMQLVVTFCH